MQKILRSGTSIAIYITLILIVIRLLLDTFGIEDITRLFPVTLGVLVASYLGIRAQRLLIKESPGEQISDLVFIMEIRAAMRPAAIVSLLYSAFMYVFYQFINPSIFPKMVAERKAEYAEQFAINNTPADQAEQILTNFETFTEFVFAPLNWATFTLFGLIIMTAVYSFLLTVIARKFPHFIAD